MQALRHPVKAFIRLKSAAFSPKYLLPTNIFISLSGSGLADLTSQIIEGRSPAILRGSPLKINWSRTLKFCVCGLVLAPFCHYWYLYLDRFLVGYKGKVLLQKVAVDTFLFSPFYVISFFYVQSKLHANSTEEFNQLLRERGPKVWLVETALWGPLQVINFRYLPTHFRVAFDTAVAFAFDTYYSYMYHHESDLQPVLDLTQPCAAKMI